MSRRRPLATFLLMLWLPPLVLFALRNAGCTVVTAEASRAADEVPAPAGGGFARDVENALRF
jgi:hypothetical protein